MKGADWAPQAPAMFDAVGLAHVLAEFSRADIGIDVFTLRRNRLRDARRRNHKPRPTSRRTTGGRLKPRTP